MSGLSMRAFLSHSSTDKRIVESVFQGLGAANCIYDRETFEEGKRSAEEILSGLSKTDIFVLFLSKDSLLSQYVQNEMKFAMEKVFSGQIQSVLIFALDETSYKALPDYLQNYTVERSNRPAQIVRRIRSRMIELELKRNEVSDIFVGREHELRDLQKALTLPPDEMRPTISIAGWQGLGRRTLAHRAIEMIFPYLKREQPTLVLEDNDSIEEFYRKLYDCVVGIPRTSEDWAKATQSFQASSHAKRIEQIMILIKTIVDAKEILFIIGDDGLIQNDGDFQPYVRDIMKGINASIRPQMILIHRRRISPMRQTQYANTAFFSLNSFADEQATELLSAHLKRREINYSRADLDDLLRFVGGHPENIRLAAEYAKQYGLQQLRRDKGQFTDIVVLRSIEILKRIDVSKLAKQICIALLDYRYLRIEDLLLLIDSKDEEIFKQLRHLEDNGILERIGTYYRISPYLVAAITRSNFSIGLAEWRTKASDQMLGRLNNISSFDSVSLSLINSAALASIRAGRHTGPGIVANFLLPSHLLTIAREEYDNGQHRRASELCRDALRNRERLTTDAQIEAHRLEAIALLRLGERSQFQETLANLENYKGKTAKRNYHFLLGFQARLDGNIDEAEKQYRLAHNLDKRNFHVLRELAHVLSKQGRFAEAELFAQSAYQIAPTNPFVIDILCSVIIGKSSPDALRDDEQVQKLLYELEVLEEGRTFFHERKAQFCQKIGHTDEAWWHASQAVAGAPHKMGPRLTRMHIALIQGKWSSLGEDIAAVERLAPDVVKEERFDLDRAKISYAILRNALNEAKELLEKCIRLPIHIRTTLTIQLASKILENPTSDPILMHWAKAHKDGVKPKRRRR